MSLLMTKQPEAVNVSNKGDSLFRTCEAEKQKMIFNAKNLPVAQIMLLETSQTTFCVAEQLILFPNQDGSEAFLLPRSQLLLQMRQTREPMTPALELPIFDEAPA